MAQGSNDHAFKPQDDCVVAIVANALMMISSAPRIY